MDKKNIKYIKISVYGTIIVCLLCFAYLDEDISGMIKLKFKLKWGSPAQKEQVLNLFMKEQQISLVPSVINAILDDTLLPGDGDLLPVRIYFKANNAMFEFARHTGGTIPKPSQWSEYSFDYYSGMSDIDRRKKVYANWKQWWSENKDEIINRKRGIGK